MKVNTVYVLEDIGAKDPNWPKQIEEAFNRVLEFCHELRHVIARPPELISFNRIVSNREFTSQDVRILRNYAAAVWYRINDKYDKEPFKSADWAQAVVQSSDNLRDTVNSFVKWFRANGGFYSE